MKSPAESILDSSEVNPDARQLLKPAVEAFLEIRAILKEELRDFDVDDPKLRYVLLTIENLFWRIDEQAEGMLVSFSYGCAAASETKLGPW